jgi:hypothetical protein
MKNVLELGFEVSNIRLSKRFQFFITLWEVKNEGTR